MEPYDYGYNPSGEYYIPTEHLKELLNHHGCIEDTKTQPDPDLSVVRCVAHNREGKTIFQDDMPKVEFLKIFKDLFNHVEQITKGDVAKELNFRVW